MHMREQIIRGGSERRSLAGARIGSTLDLTRDTPGPVRLVGESVSLKQRGKAGREVCGRAPGDPALREPDLRDLNKFQDRASNSTAAKQAMLERFRARPPADDPEVVARKAEREAVRVAREARTAERDRLRRENEARLEAERIAREKADKERKEREDLERIERELALEAARKAARDARYAARKAAKRRK